MQPLTLSAPPFFLHISSEPSADHQPELKSRPPRASSITLQKIDSDAADPVPEPLLQARPDTLMGSLGVGAMIGMIVARLTLPDTSSMLLGGIAGMAASGMVYAAGVCVLACHQRESGHASVWMRGDKVQHLREQLAGAHYSDIQAAMQETADDDVLVDTTSTSHDSSSGADI